MHPVLSVVVPVYNEEDVLPLLVERLRPVLDGTGVTYEVVAVDDGSKDASAVIMQRIHREWPQFRIVRLRANAGHQAAISAGLARSNGDYMVTIDADLQDPPETIAEMLKKARTENLDVVYGVRNDRTTDTAFKRNTAQAFYATLRRLSKTDAPANAGDFRLMSRATVDAVNALPEHHRVLRLVVPQLGFPSGEVYYKREERAAGESKYPLSKMIALSLDSLTSGSMAPLRLATFMGLIGFLGAVVIFLYALFSSITGRAVAGWTSTVMAVAAVGAVQLVCLGILGEYVGRMYSMMQRRPTYFVAHDTGKVRLDSQGYAADMEHEDDYDGALDSPEGELSSGGSTRADGSRRPGMVPLSQEPEDDDRIGIAPAVEHASAPSEDLASASSEHAASESAPGRHAGPEPTGSRRTRGGHPDRSHSEHDAAQPHTDRRRVDAPVAVASPLAAPETGGALAPTTISASATPVEVIADDDAIIDPASTPDTSTPEPAFEIGEDTAAHDTSEPDPSAGSSSLSGATAVQPSEPNGEVEAPTEADNEFFEHRNVEASFEPAVEPTSAFDRQYDPEVGSPGVQTIAPVSAEAEHRRARPWQDTPSETPVIDAAARQAVRRTSANKLTPGSDDTGK